MDYDSAFEFAPTPDTQEKMLAMGVGDGSMNADVVRDAFLVFMADCIGDYTSYIVPPSAESKKGGPSHFDDQEAPASINSDKFLAAAAANDRLSPGGGGLAIFLKKLFSTQMFHGLMQDRTSSSANVHRLVFFELAVELCRKLKLVTDLEGTSSRDDDGAEKSPRVGSPSPAEQLSMFYNGTAEGGGNLQYLAKGAGGTTPNERRSESQHQPQLQLQQKGMPVGLVSQLVHEELGNFKLKNDYRDLSEELYESHNATIITTIPEQEQNDEEEDKSGDDSYSFESKCQSPGAKQRAALNQYSNEDINAMKEDQGSDADNSVSISRRPALRIPGPSARGIEIKVEGDGSLSPDSGMRRMAQTQTEARQWSYPVGWPTPMEDAYFAYPDSVLPMIITSLRKQAHELKAQNNRLIMTRSSKELHRRDRLELNTKNPVESAVQIFGAYFLCLPTLIAVLDVEEAEGGEGKEGKKEFTRALGLPRENPEAAAGGEKRR